MRTKPYIFIFFLFVIFSYSQTYENIPEVFKDYQLSSEQYISGIDGKVFMNVNLWGAVTSPGTKRVYDGIDFASLLSIVGGPNKNANLKKVKLYREKPDENGQLIYIINLNHFIKTGDRSNFIKIKPNDTIIIPRKVFGILLTQIGTVNTILSALSLYLQFYNFAIK